MSNKTQCILAAALIAAAIFANCFGISLVNSPTAATTRQYHDSLMHRQITTTYNQRIVRTVRCHVAAGTSPSLITQQADKLYEERNHACQKASASK